MKVLFVVSDFELGGITSSLRNLCNELIARGNEVDILNLPRVQILPEGFNEKIKLICISGRTIYWDFGMPDVRSATLWKRPLLLCFGFLKKILSKLGKWEQFVFDKLPILAGYDIAVAYRQNPINYYIAAHKTDAKCKVGFWHGDPVYMGDTSSWDGCVFLMDKIACVSEAVGKEMTRKYPQLTGKVSTVYNIFNANEIKRRSLEHDKVLRQGCFNIVTVARVEFKYKQLQMIPAICRKLKQKGIKFEWTIVGDGPDMSELNVLMTKERVSDCMNLVGAKENPYPYIKQADLFVLTSVSESYGMVIMESLILGIPVIAGEYPALKEILSDGKEGIIASNSQEGIFNAVYHAITDEEFYKELKQNCMKYEYDSELTYKQFVSLMGDNYA